MQPNLCNVSVRLEPQTLETIDKIVTATRREATSRTLTYERRPYSRSELIRHAITTGLDVLTNQPALELLEP